ncbi:sucrase ferredoxin [Hahella aquimaris]|uniref:sucrase ferredoxin n=1 Tax=Hahella sp. HNIBRBA332 TaxID=3015983 RepID=UPI00273AA455|nr:sucrase ferredoxin [Hahella sp. HNIBRBA332]WLQ16400.1 sucrase ferredoxin [Hahella sp. HNIBRBA332]
MRLVAATPKFCAQYSQSAGEPLPGTGFHPQSNLLLSWPIAGWTRTYHQAKDMSETESMLIAGLVEQGRRVNLMHRADQSKSLRRAYLMPEREAYDIPREELAAFLLALQQGRSLAAWHSGPAPTKVVLCCTHGVKDKCCAKFGVAGFKALERAAQSFPGVEVWQSSHLGGCRFAATALVFPDLRKYGRIEPERARPLLESEMSDLPYLPCFRGNSALTPIQQIAEVEARKRLGAEGHQPTQLEIVTEQSHGEERAEIAFSWRSDTAHGRLVIHLETASFLRYDMCSDIDAGAGPTERRTWRGSAALES